MPARPAGTSNVRVSGIFGMSSRGWQARSAAPRAPAIRRSRSGPSVIVAESVTMAVRVLAKHCAYRLWSAGPPVDTPGRAMAGDADPRTANATASTMMILCMGTPGSCRVNDHRPGRMSAATEFSRTWSIESTA